MPSRAAISPIGSILAAREISMSVGIAILVYPFRRRWFSTS
jgi:hypothetical protein